MQLENNKVYTFKLNSGEELMGKLLSATDEHYIIDSPLSTAPTQQGLQLVPALFTSELNVEVNLYKKSVAIIGEPRVDVADAYRESTTGIKVPDKQILI